MAKSVDEILSSVMGNEELMSKIKDAVKNGGGDSSSSLENVISLISPCAQDTSHETDEGANGISKNEPEEKLSVISSLGDIISRNTPLLCALKPYLSKEKCQLIDSIVRISKISGVLDLI